MDEKTSTEILVQRAINQRTQLSAIIPQLWEGEVQKALKTPSWIRDLPPSPRKPLTFRQKIRLQWYRLLAWWRKPEDEDEDD